MKTDVAHRAAQRGKTTQAQIADWNYCFPVGSPCMLRLDDGTEVQTRTRSEAWLICVNPARGRLPYQFQTGIGVVQVEGKSGGWDLDRVRMMETHKP